MQTIRFMHYVRDKAEYKCSCTNSDFSFEPAVVQAPPAPKEGMELTVDVRYEPSAAGDVSAKITISSATGGETVCKVTASGLPPRPQGPIEVKVIVRLVVSYVSRQPQLLRSSSRTS